MPRKTKFYGGLSNCASSYFYARSPTTAFQGADHRTGRFNHGRIQRAFIALSFAPRRTSWPAAMDGGGPAPEAPTVYRIVSEHLAGHPHNSGGIALYYSSADSLRGATKLLLLRSRFGLARSPGGTGHLSPPFLTVGARRDSLKPRRGDTGSNVCRPSGA
jgi:hypothetical protein